MIRCPSYLVWSKTFITGVGLTDLSEFGRYLGQNKAIVSVFHGPVIYFNVVLVLIRLDRVVVPVKYLAFNFPSDPVPRGRNLTTS